MNKEQLSKIPTALPMPSLLHIILAIIAHFNIFFGIGKEQGSALYRWMLSYDYPLNRSDTTNLFGWRVHPIYGDMRYHNGIDVQAPDGTPIYAIGNGTIIGNTDENTGYGTWIKLEFEPNLVAYYCHLSVVSVNLGDMVTKGQQLGLTGATGITQGGHIHFGIYSKQGTDDTWVDPLLYINDTLNSVDGLHPNIAGSGAERWRPYVVDALIKNGLDATEARIGRTLAQINTESTGDPSAINDWDSNAIAGTPSMGLMQCIQTTFDYWAFDDHHDIWNGYDNMLAGMAYEINKDGVDLLGWGIGLGY